MFFLNLIICITILIGFYENTKIYVFHKVPIVIIISIVMFPSRNLNSAWKYDGYVPIAALVYLKRPNIFSKVVVLRFFLILFV